MPLGDNVQRITTRQPASRRRAVSAARPAEPAPYDNLLSLATEIEERQARGRRPHLAPVPAVPSLPSLREPPPPPPLPPTAPPTLAAPVPAVARSRRRERALLGVAGALAVAIGVLLIWGTDIERLLRPGIGERSESVETDGADTATGAEVPSQEGSLAPAQSSISVAPPTSAAPNVDDGTTGSAGIQDPSAPSAAPVANCDAASVWPTVTAMNDISPVEVAWVTCSERYATAGLVPADAPPETPPSVIVTLRSDGGVWALLSIGEPAACAPGASAVDPAFPTSLCP